MLALCLLAFALRIVTLDAQPIWWDEAISIHLATSTLAEIVDNRAGNLHPPLYFFLLKGWVALAGDSAFAVRFFSAWFSVLLVPALYAIGRRWLGRRVGAIAAVLAALSPLYLAYAQEARVYALLPLVYVALLDAACRLARSSSPRWLDFLRLALVEALALGFHYTALFAVAFVLVALAVRLWRCTADLKRMLVAQGLVALLLAPWLAAILARADALGARLEMSNWMDGPVTLAHFARLVWVFHLTGQTGLVSDPLAMGMVALFAVALATALLYLLVRVETRWTAALLLGAWLVPLATAFAIWWLRPLSHPRYVIAFTPALLLLVAYGIDRLVRRSRLERAVTIGLALSLGAPFVLGLILYHTPRFAKDDTRAIAAAVAARDATGDLLIVPPEDPSVPYYYDGPAQVDMSWAGDTPAGWHHLTGLTANAEHVFLVDYYRATRDLRGLFPFALEAAGSLIERVEAKGLFLRVYRMDGPVTPPQLDPTSARFGPLHLTGAWVEQGAPADTAVTLALRWQLDQPTDAPLRVGLRLQGDDGWPWAAIDDWILDAAVLPTDRWLPGTTTTTYHVLPLPPGTPPLTYDLRLGVYRVGEDGRAHPFDLLDPAGNPSGQSFDLGSASLGAPIGLSSDPYGTAGNLPAWADPVPLGGGLLLDGAALDRDTTAPGQPLFVTLVWRAEARASAPLSASLVLEQAGEAVTVQSSAIGGAYTTERWTPGQTVVEHRRLVVPPGAADGPASVTVYVGAQRVAVGEVAVSAGERLFDPPPMAFPLQVTFGDVAELLGYDVEQTTIVAGEPVPLTLYWRALDGAAAADYTVFTHVLAADGRLVGQHDGPPAGGSRPTPGWVPGEIIVDRHDMAFREPYTGPAWIEIGLYNTTSVERVPASDGGLQVVLPVTLTVVER